MSETVTPVETTQLAPEVQNFFDTDTWKSTPTIIEPASNSKDPVIDEKDKKIEETKPEITAPGQPENTPTATPDPIQNRPADANAEKKSIPAKPEATVGEPITFANEESEKVFNLIKEGKTDEVLLILNEQKKLKEVDKMQPADILKLNLQYQHKEFTPEEVNDLFLEQYEMPEKPVQGISELDEEFADRVAAHEKRLQQIENRIKRDAKPAMAELLKLSKEIVLPDIKAGNIPTQTEPTQEELAELKLQKENFLKDVESSAKTFNGYNATFKDKEVEIPVAYVVTEEEKNSIKPLLESAFTDLGDFFTKVGWVDEKGQVKTAKMMEDLHLIQHKESVFSRLVSETGNKRHQESIKSIKNIDYSGVKNNNAELGITVEQAQQGLANAFFV